MLSGDSFLCRPSAHIVRKWPESTRRETGLHYTQIPLPQTRNQAKHPRVALLRIQRAVLLEAMLPTNLLEIKANLKCHWMRSEEHTSELQSLMRISYAVFCLTK